MVLNPIDIYVKNDGTEFQTVQTPIYRLSNNVNIIHLIAPFPRLSVMRVNFLLANNQTILSRPMTLLDETRIVDNDGTLETWNIWEYFLDSATLSAVSTLKSSPLYVSFVETEVSWYDGEERKDASDPAYYGLYQNTTMLDLQRQYKLPTLDDWAIVVYTNEGFTYGENEELNDWLQHYIYKFDYPIKTTLKYETYDEIKAFDGGNSEIVDLSFEYVRDDELEGFYVPVFNVTNTAGMELSFVEMTLRFYRNNVLIGSQTFTDTNNTLLFATGTNEKGLVLDETELENAWNNTFVKADVASVLVKKTSMIRLDVQPSIPAPNEEVIITTTDLLLEQVVILNQITQQLQIAGGIENVDYNTLDIANPSTKTTNEILNEIVAVDTLPFGVRIIASNFVASDTPITGRAIISIINRGNGYVVVEMNSQTNGGRYFYIKNATVQSGWFRYATNEDITSLQGEIDSDISTHNTSETAHSDIREDITDITNGIALFQKIKFDIDTPAEVLNVGEMRWSDSYSDTLEIKLNDEVTLQLGEETLFKARASQNILNGQAVYISGGTGSAPLPIVSLATNTGNGAASRCLGIATEDISSGQDGFITVFGRVNRINTNAWDVGDTIYLGVNGALTNVEPTPPTRTTILGFVVRKHSSDGAILITPKCMPFIHELSDVLITSIANGDVVKWNGTTNRWENYNLDSALATKVDKVTGYALSQNDFTNALKSKLDDIEASADVNIIEGVIVDGVTLTPDGNKKVTIPLANVSTEKDGLISWEEKKQISDNATAIEALQGAYIFRGQINNSTAQITANKSLLTTYISTNYSRNPLLGDTLKDNDKNEWYYSSSNYGVDGHNAWANMGQNIIGSANGTTLGVVKSSDDISFTAGQGTVLQADKVKNELSIGGKTFDGSADVDITLTDLGLQNLTNDAQVKKLASSTDGNVPTWNGTNGDALSDGYGVATSVEDVTNKLVRSDVLYDVDQAKIDKNYSDYTLRTLETLTDTDIILVRWGTTTGRATVADLKSFIIETSGEFDPTVDYSNQGLGAKFARIIFPDTLFEDTATYTERITAGNSNEIVQVGGKKAKLSKVQGYSAVVPNVVSNGDFSNGTTGWTTTNAGTLSVTGGIASFTATSIFGGIYQNYSFIPNNVYYLIARYKTSSPSVRFFISNPLSSTGYYHSGSGNYEIIKGTQIATATSTQLRMFDYNASGWTQIDVDYMFSINLTQMVALGLIATPTQQAYETWLEAQTTYKVGDYFQSINASVVANELKSIGENKLKLVRDTDTQDGITFDIENGVLLKGTATAQTDIVIGEMISDGSAYKVGGLATGVTLYAGTTQITTNTVVPSGTHEVKLRVASGTVLLTTLQPYIYYNAHALNVYKPYVEDVITLPTATLRSKYDTGVMYRDYIDFESYNIVRYVDNDGSLLATPTATPFEPINAEYVAYNYGTEVIDIDNVVKPTITTKYVRDVVTQADTNTEYIKELQEEVILLDTNKVDKVTGKQLSTEDYTTTEKNKLANIAENAQVNVIESIVVDGTTLTPSAKAITIPIANTSTEKDGLLTWEEKLLIAQHETKVNALQGAYVYRGTIAQSQPTQQQLTDRIDALFERTPILGDVLVDTNDIEWYFDGSLWNNMGQATIGVASASTAGIVRVNYTETDTNKKLRVNGNGDAYVIVPEATVSVSGLLSSTDKAKLSAVNFNLSWVLFFGTQVINKTAQHLFTTDMLKMRNAYLEIDTDAGTLMTQINGNSAFSGTQEGISYEVESTSTGFSFTYIDGTPASITITEIRFFPFGSQ